MEALRHADGSTLLEPPTVETQNRTLLERPTQSELKAGEFSVLSTSGDVKLNEIDMVSLSH